MMSQEDEILHLVKDLALSITERQSDDDAEIHAFVENAAIALSYLDAPTPNKSAVREQVDGLALKFQVHGFFQLADTLRTKFKELVEIKEDTFVNPETPWSMIDLLMQLSWKPMEYAQQVALGSIVPEKRNLIHCVAEEFDWPAHLNEGNFAFPPDCADSDNDEWSQLSDDSSTEELFVKEAYSTTSSMEVKPSEESIATTSTHEKIQNDAEQTSSSYASDPLLPATLFPEVDRKPESERPPKPLAPHVEKARQLYQKAYQAKQRIEQEIQDSDWFSAEKMVATPGMPDLGPEATVPDKLSEWQVLRELLWMLLAPADCRCFGLDADGKFKPRPDFTVVDVDTHVLWTYLRRYCLYFDMVREAELFGKNLDGVGKEPPATYRAYYAALQENIAAFKRAVSQLMNNVAKQEDVHTLISVNAELEPSFDRLDFVISLHRRATCDWRNKPNWFSAIRLLSVLYWTVTESLSCETAAILVDLFVKSLCPYVTIIDNLLTKGECIDFYHEFIIYRADNLESSMRESWDDGFYIRPYHSLLRDLNLRAPSMLENVVEAIVLGAKSVYVVSRLDKLCKVAGYQTKCVLYNEMVSRLEVQFASYVTLEEPPTTPAKVESDFLRDTSEFQQNLMAEMLTDPFLRVAFEGIIDFEEKEVSSEESQELKHPCERLKRYAAKGAIRYQLVFERVFQDLISDKYNILGQLINTVMRRDVQIGKHLKVLRAVFMIEAGDLISVCYDCLIKKDKDEPYWLYSHFLSNNIEDYFDRSFPGYNNFRVAVDQRFLDDNILEAIDGIELTYKAEWPLSFIVNKANLVLYNEIFRLLLKLKLTLTSLERLRFTDLHSPGAGRKSMSAALSSRLVRWQLLRFRLINAVGGIHCFTMNHITHTFSPALDTLVVTANDFDLIVQEHCKYLQTVHGLCANPLCSPKLVDSFAHLLDLSHGCVDLWPYGRRANIDGKLSDMEGVYNIIHRDIRRELADFIPDDSRLHIDGLQALFYRELHS